MLAVGSNLGDRLGTLHACVHAIGRLPDTDVLAISPVYQTAPVGGPPQPDYLNAVLVVATGLPPRDLLAAAHRIEAAAGRVRAERFGPRTLDIDIISYAGEVSDDPVLTLPHPRAHERAFVLAPWHDIDPAPNCPAAARWTTCSPAWTATASSACPAPSCRSPAPGSAAPVRRLS